MFKGRIYSGSWVQIRHFSLRLFKPGIYDYYSHSVDPWWPERVRICSKLAACPKKIAFGDGKGDFFFSSRISVGSKYHNIKKPSLEHFSKSQDFIWAGEKVQSL